MKAKFELLITHVWVDGFGWENSIYRPEDFLKVERYGNFGFRKVMLKGYFDETNFKYLKGEFIRCDH